MSSRTVLEAFWDWHFLHPLEELRRAYIAARESSDRDRRQIEKEWAALEAEVAAGRASFTEEDEGGQITYDRGEYCGEMLSDIENVLTILREAFTISLYHLWERQLKRHMKTTEYKEDEAFAFLKKSGRTLDEPTLKALKLSANVAKHSEGRSADRLYKLRPDLFDAAEMTKWGAQPSHEYLKITDQTLDQFFEAVRRSWSRRLR